MVVAVVLIDYFSRWSKTNPKKDKSAPTVAQFLYEVICRHRCYETQINDHGRKFVNDVNTELRKLMGVQQRVTSAYHSQPNGPIERQNSEGIRKQSL